MAVALGQMDGEHWATHIREGSFTAPGAVERLALVGNIGEQDEIRWVVVGQPEAAGDWRLLGVSEWLGSGFDAAPSFYLPPDLLDFDGDGRQELLHHYFRMQRGSTTAADVLYRWDGQSMARVWDTDVTSNNTAAGSQDVPHPYRQNYQATWEWVGLDADEPDEIVLRQQTAFSPTGESLGGESWERAFRWDGNALRPFAPTGPSGDFAYTALGRLWLWRDHTVRPLGVEHVHDFYWSADGLRLAWWAKSPLESEGGEAVHELSIGVYDLATGERREFSLGQEVGLVALHWALGGRLAYALPGQTPTLLDPETGRLESLPDLPLSTWSPDGGRVAYEKDRNLYVYDLAAERERSLVTAPEGPDAPKPLPDPVWSPRGDWIAYYLANDDLAWVGLVAPDLSQPVSGFGILETFDGRESPELQFAWSPGGSRLAVLTNVPNSMPPLATLYVGDLPLGEGQGVGLPEWRVVLRLQTAIQDVTDVKMAWSPDEERIALASGDGVWDVSVLEKAAEAEETPEPGVLPRWRFSMPRLEWTTLEWSPNGRGFLAGAGWVYDEHLYWFPSDGDDPMLLLTASLGAARWSPRSVGGAQRSGMVLVEYTDGVPMLHFVSQNGADIPVLARGAETHTPFYVGGNRVYYNKTYAERNGGASLFVSDPLAGCRPPLPSPDARRLAWLCDDGAPDWTDLISGTARINFRLMLTDDRGRSAREAWSYLEAGPDYRDFSLVSWRGDGRAVYLSRPKYGTAWAYFDYNPGLSALDLSTGQLSQLGELDDVHDGRVSVDGTWLAQSRIAAWPDEGVFVSLRSLVDGTELGAACAEGTSVAGDFSFSPDNAWLAWREWATAPGGSLFLIRALHLPDGEALTIYGDAELTAPEIGGWLSRDELVLVHPVLADGSGGHSTVVTLPAVGMGNFLSPFSFLGMLGEAP